MRAHRVDQRLPRLDRLVRGADDAVPRRQPGALRRAAGDHLAQHRLERRPVQAQPDPLERVRFHLRGRIVAQVERRGGDMAALVDRLEPHRLALQRRLQHAPAHFLPGGHRLAVDRAHRVARVQARGRSDARRRRLREHRLRFGQAVHVKPGVDQHREHEIEQRARDDDGEALPHALAVEGAPRLRRRHCPLALVEHLYVAAERHGSDHPLGAVGPQAPGGERPAESHRKAQHLDAAEPRDEVVAVFVHDDQHAERDDEGEDGVQQAHAARARTCAPAARRASASAAKMASSSSAACVCTRSRVF
jgi:hypothetical protein